MSASIRVSTRIACGLAALLMLAAAWFSARSLLSDLYVLAAQQHEAVRPDSVVAQHAGRLAVEFAPWKTQARRRYALTLAQAQQSTAALSAMKDVIRWSPVSGEDWAIYAQLSAQARGFDASYRLAVDRAVHLAPNVPPVRRHIALQGVSWWTLGRSEERRLWIESMRSSLHMDLSFFLATVVWMHQEEAFCANAGHTLKLKQWCDWTAFARAACLSGKPLYPEQRKYCDTYGYPVTNDAVIH